VATLEARLVVKRRGRANSELQNIATFVFFLEDE